MILLRGRRDEERSDEVENDTENVRRGQVNDSISSLNYKTNPPRAPAVCSCSLLEANHR